LEIDEHDVGSKPLERGDKPAALDEDRDVAQTGIAQAFLDHGRARRAFVDDRDLQPDLLLQCSKIIAAAKEVNQRLQFPGCSWDSWRSRMGLIGRANPVPARSGAFPGR